MTDQDPQTPPGPQAKKTVRRRPQRKTGQPSIIEQSDHRDEYIRLMRGGWSSGSLERYAQWRYGEKIDDKVFRIYRITNGIERVRSVMMCRDFDPDQVRSLMAVRQELIELQADRIALDAGTERDTGKLLPQTHREIQLLSELLDAAKTDMQDLGLFPHRADHVPINAPEVPANLPSVASLQAVAPGFDPAVLARALHENVIPMPDRPPKSAGGEGGGTHVSRNGHSNGLTHGYSS